MRDSAAIAYIHKYTYIHTFNSTYGEFFFRNKRKILFFILEMVFVILHRVRCFFLLLFFFFFLSFIDIQANYLASDRALISIENPHTISMKFNLAFTYFHCDFLHFIFCVGCVCVHDSLRSFFFA